MLTTLVSFGDDFASTTLETAALITQSFGPYLSLVLGVLIVLLIVSVLIKSIHK